MSETITIRRATVDDAATITAQRRAMFEDMGAGTPEGLHIMDRQFLPWVIDHLLKGEYLGWLAVDAQGDREIVAAGAGLLFYPWLPRPDGLGMKRAYILNVYTHPHYRRRGLARRLILDILDYCRAEGFKHVTLHASDEGRQVYTALGFRATNEMRIELEG